MPESKLGYTKKVLSTNLVRKAEVKVEVKFEVGPTKVFKESVFCWETEGIEINKGGDCRGRDISRSRN